MQMIDLRPRGAVLSGVMSGPLMSAGLALAMVGLLAGCASEIETEAEYPTRRSGDQAPVYGERQGLLDGVRLFGGDEQQGGATGSGITVNSFLWRAALDTASFMPLKSADPYGGVILSDWHSPATTPGERFKVNIYILDSQLRSDGIRVAVFRQIRDQTGGWRDSAVAEGTATEFENAILTRARQLRIATVRNES